MEKKFQIFVSSTYEDLKDERNEIIKAVLEMGHIPVGMEMFSAADEEQWKVIARTIDSVDYYAVVVAHRYGSVTSEGISYTEKEFDYASSKGVPVLGFVIDDVAPWPSTRTESDSKKLKKLAAFKTKVKARLVQFWSNRDDLRGKFSVALMKSIINTPRTGWVRADEVAGPLVTKELTRLSSENAALRDQVDSMKKAVTESENAVGRAMRVLAKNEVRFQLRKTANWKEADRYTLSLADIFGYVAPNLIDENSSLGVAQDLALKVLRGPKYFKNWPIGKNQTAEIIADFAALDLVEPSKKKHQVSDTNTYWSLTKLGKKLLQEFRKVKLEEGLAELPEQSDATNG
ncbi:DUF4062 domain-containing protein [Halopseudomonas phragmitis]|uniref:DUF4062 domain-containing protein n=1 Tax=Halopseudomonas phragmitis TaxID=1931241 RepID=A0A1V0B0K6_9GAMM|nr:DUF4062 domain-containing protein [Halopseudomonas phragmitis]AQZ93410.1 hypothetical protein BVH74_00895 [Halopseudomonas phragmitis]